MMENKLRKALDQVNNDVLVHLYLGQHPEMAAKLKGAEAIEDNLDKLSIAFAIDLDRIKADLEKIAFAQNEIAALYQKKFAAKNTEPESMTDAGAQG